MQKGYELMTVKAISKNQTEELEKIIQAIKNFDKKKF